MGWLDGALWHCYVDGTVDFLVLTISAGCIRYFYTLKFLMKIVISLTFLFFLQLNFSKAQTTRELRKSIELFMPKGNGENGGTVAVNLKNRNIYATIVGNKTYSMAFFNGAGEMTSPPDLALLADIRGLWYNPVLKSFQANIFGGNWINYVIDDAGIPYDVKPHFSNVPQPNANSVAVFNQRENVVYFLKGSMVVTVDINTGKPVPEKTYALKIGFTRKNPAPVDYKADSIKTPSNYNSTTVIFTGITNAEFGLLNVATREIELYSKNDGLIYQKLKLPKEATPRDKFNFGYANNTYFLFDKNKRSWIGYR
jgi:hypothetical protein